MISIFRQLNEPKFHITAVSATIAIIVLIFVPPVPQNPEFHNFADQRVFFGIPHFWNVVTNIPFILLGITGLVRLKTQEMPGVIQPLGNAYTAFFTGLVLIGFGSGWYHLAPVNQTLVWDRLPITISFMSFFTIIFGETVSRHTAKRLLWVLILFGIASVIYWYITETQGIGDLRPYGLVQFLPLLMIPVMLLFYRSCLDGTSWIFGMLIVYVAAKIFEMFDHAVYNYIGFSGHSLKHLFAALGAWLFLTSLSFRHQVSTAHESHDPRR